ncbi:MAG: PadR family transcriptional regulator [Anaerolineaceae bacterium]
METNTLDTLLAQWEETYKKGLLTFWLLLLLSQRKAYPYEMKSTIMSLSQGSISADENSIYRALNRMSQSGLVGSELHSSETGPSRRYFFLTDQGTTLLSRFITRNILIFQNPAVAGAIKKVLSTSNNMKG